MFEDAYLRLDADDKKQILDQINPLLDSESFLVENTEILAKELSFYPGYQLLDIHLKDSVPALHRYVIFGPDQVEIIDWSNEPIYILNEKVPITLNEDNVRQYVRFFFSMVKGKHGLFRITQSTEDIEWREDPPPSARKAIGSMIEPLSVNSVNDDGDFELSMCLMFKDSLFKSDVLVKKNGLVEMKNERLLVESMPVLDEVMAQ